MPIDIIGKQILNDIKKLPNCENAIIAGGFCRDAILGGDWKDIDIFVPSKGFEKLELPKHYSWAKVPKDPYKGKFLSQVLDLYYMDAIKIQLVSFDLPEKDFGKNAVADFNFGIDQAWTEDGENLQQSELFRTDMFSYQITLLKECPIVELPKHIEKFLRLQKKYARYGFKFNCPNMYWKQTPQTGKQNTNQKDWRKGKTFLKDHKWWLKPEDMNVNNVNPNVDVVWDNAAPPVGAWNDLFLAVDQVIPDAQVEQGQV